MRRKPLLLFLSALLCGLTACSEAPKEALVSQKNNERLVEEAQEEPDADKTLDAARTAAPETWSYSYQDEDGTLNITADQVPVSFPDRDTIPMYKVSCGEFTQDFVTKVYDYFFPEGGTWQMTGSDLTKDLCQQRVLECQENIAETKEDDTLTEEEKEEYIQYMEEEIKYWQDQYETAPEEPTVEKVPVDSTLTEEEWEGLDGPFTVKGIFCATDDAWLSVTSVPADSDTSSDIHYERTTEWTYSGVYGTPVSELSGEELQSIGISSEEAQKLAEEFFSSIGVTAQVHDVLAVKGCKDLGEEEDNVIETSNVYNAYKLICARTVEDIEMAVTTSHYVSEDDTVSTWLYEQIDVYVDAEGIVYLDWQYPLTVEDTVSENVGIISFEEASGIFEQMTPLIYQGKMEEYNDSQVEHSYDVTITDARLCLMRVRDTGAARTGLLSPVWVFYGDEKTINHFLEEQTQGVDGGDYTSSEEQPWIILAVNAVDGSVIDIVEGY